MVMTHRSSLVSTSESLLMMSMPSEILPKIVCLPAPPRSVCVCVCVCVCVWSHDRTVSQSMALRKSSVGANDSPSRCAHGANVMKNCDPFVLAPELAIDSTPAPVCLRSRWNSSANRGLPRHNITQHRGARERARTRQNMGTLTHGAILKGEPMRDTTG
jgi:hypothetical protein